MMRGEGIFDLKTDEQLLTKLKKMAGRAMSKEERHRQMLSYVAGNIDDKNVTYENIKEMITRLKRGEKIK